MHYVVYRQHVRTDIMTRNALHSFLDWAILSNLVDDSPSEDLHYLLRCADLVTNPDTASETINDLASAPVKL